MRNWIFWLICLATILPFASAHGQEPTTPQPPIWHIPVMPVLPPAPVQPQPQPPQQTYRIHYPTPLRSWLFGSHLVPVQPPPTMIRTPYLWEGSR